MNQTIEYCFVGHTFIKVTLLQSFSIDIDPIYYLVAFDIRLNS